MKNNSCPAVPANCGKCGLCLSACPVYRLLKEEQASPRARLRLIKAHDRADLAASPLLKELISRCLMCGSCARACPSGINHYQHFMQMRAKMAAALGEEPAIKALTFLLSREFMLRAGARMAALGQRITPEFLADKYQVGNIPLSRLPRLNARRFREKRAGIVPPARSVPTRGRVAYFTGCATNFMFEDTGNATLKILTALGFEVVIPETQVCCAIPMLFHGALETAAANIRTNIEALAQVSCDWVIVDCTTCGAALKEEYPAFLSRTDARGQETLAAQAISRKTTDILSFLAAQDSGLALARGREKVRTAYHAPCHSRNCFASHDKVRQMLKTIPDIDYIPLPGEADCCGGGGTFFFEHPDLARQMMDKKLAQVRESGVELWLTDCPVCRINLAGSLEPGDAIEVCHPVVLAARALEEP